MLTKITLLTLAVTAAPGQVLEGTAAAPTFYALAKTPGTEANAYTYAKNGYACIRRGFTYVHPMNVDSNGAANTTPSTTVNAFFQTKVSQLGTANTSSSAAGTITTNGGCFKSSSDGIPASNTDSALLFSAGTTAVANRLKYYASGTYSTDTAAAVMIGVDFALASTFQDSWDGTGTRAAAPSNYCDVQVKTISQKGAGVSFVTTQGLAGTTKCTYIIKVAATMGAPSFIISKLDYWKFQLHYVEWSSADMTGSAWLTTNKYVGTVTANTYPQPIHATYPAGAAANDDLKFDFPQASNAPAHANWWPQTRVPGTWQVSTFTAQLPGSDSVFTSANQQQTLDNLQAQQWAGYGDKVNSEYNSQKSSYENKKNSYNNALKQEKARKNDIFKSLFEKEVTVPERPQPPQQPPEF